MQRKIRCRRVSGNGLPKSVVVYVGIGSRKLSSVTWDGTPVAGISQKFGKVVPMRRFENYRLRVIALCGWDGLALRQNRGHERFC